VALRRYGGRGRGRGAPCSEPSSGLCVLAPVYSSRRARTTTVSHSCACIGSPCLRHCVHGASIGVTGQLVLNFDHYCVWVFNAVGLGNYRYFLLTVLQVRTRCVLCQFQLARCFVHAFH
jgi:hypothetical protein